MSNLGQIMDGKLISQKLRDKLKEEIDRKCRGGTKDQVIPHLNAVLVGNDSASQVYISQKEKACQEVGIKFTLIHLPEESSLDQVLTVIKRINQDSSVHGCLVQLPLPKHLDKDLIISCVSVIKDVDCFHSENIGRLVLNQPNFIPATPHGIQLMLEHYQIPTRGKNCVIIGKSLIVGQPLMNLMSLETGLAATVTACDRYTQDLTDHTRRADILVVAAGIHHLINDPEQIKHGAVVIDVGIHRITDSSRKSGYRLEGDVNYQAIKDHCSYITPVPGGVGPMTVVSLLYNTWGAYLHQCNSKSLPNNGHFDP